MGKKSKSKKPNSNEIKYTIFKGGKYLSGLAIEIAKHMVHDSFNKPDDKDVRTKLVQSYANRLSGTELQAPLYIIETSYKTKTQNYET